MRSIQFTETSASLKIYVITFSLHKFVNFLHSRFLHKFTNFHISVCECLTPRINHICWSPQGLFHIVAEA